ncbi:MAG: HIT domain-containing protein [Acidobacteriota bacterium]
MSPPNAPLVHSPADDPSAAIICQECGCHIPYRQIILENEHCWFLRKPQPVLEGSGIIMPKIHRDTVFDLLPKEWAATREILHAAKALIDRELAPQGYNVGWNCGDAGGQQRQHAHLHVIPRFSDEPYAGRGIRWWLNQPSNRRPQASPEGAQNSL